MVTPAPEIYTIDENAVLQLPTSLSFEPQSQAPVTGPTVKRRGGMSQLTMLEEEEEEGEESEETGKNGAEVGDLPEDESLESDAETSISICKLFNPRLMLLQKLNDFIL